MIPRSAYRKSYTRPVLGWQVRARIPCTCTMYTCLEKGMITDSSEVSDHYKSALVWQPRGGAGKFLLPVPDGMVPGVVSSGLSILTWSKLIAIRESVV